MVVDVRRGKLSDNERGQKSTDLEDVCSVHWGVEEAVGQSVKNGTLVPGWYLVPGRSTVQIVQVSPPSNEMSGTF